MFRCSALRILERLLFAEHLHDRGDGGVGSARGIGIGHLHFAREFRLDQVAPARRRGELLPGEKLGVVAHAQHAEVEADGPVLRLLGLLLRPWLQLRKQRRLVFLRQALFRGLQVRVAGAAEPEVELRVGLFRGDLRERFAGALQRHPDLDAGFLSNSVATSVAPLRLHRTDDVQLLAAAGSAVPTRSANAAASSARRADLHANRLRICANPAPRIWRVGERKVIFVHRAEGVNLNGAGWLCTRTGEGADAQGNPPGCSTWAARRSKSSRWMRRDASGCGGACPRPATAMRRRSLPSRGWFAMPSANWDCRPAAASVGIGTPGSISRASGSAARLQFRESERPSDTG